MAWLEIHQTVWTNRKTLHLAGLLGIERELAAAKMIQLWHWCLDNAEDGELGALPPYVVAQAASWQGDPATFIDAAVEAGYMDRVDVSLKLHDWWDYAGRLIERRRRDAERKREERGHPKDTAKPVQRTSNGHPTDRPQMSRCNSTVQNSTEQKRTSVSEASVTSPSLMASPAPEPDEPERVLTLLDELSDSPLPRTDTTKAGVWKSIQGLKHLDPLEVAIDYVRWQETLPPKKRHKDPVRGWRNQMQMRRDNEYYYRPSPHTPDAALPMVPVDMLERAKRRTALIEANSA